MSSKTMLPVVPTPADVNPAAPDITRVQRSKGEVRLAEIVQAAREVFEEDGYATFSARRVAARAGITLGNLQYYFRTKEELLRVTLELGMRETLERYAELINRQGENASSRYSALAERIFLDIYDTKLTNFLIEAWAFGHREPYAAELMGGIYSQYLDGIAGLIKQINQTFTMDECDVRAFALAALAGGMMLFERESGELEKDNAAFARTAKRYMQKIAGLSGKQRLEGNHAELDSLDAGKKVRSDSAGTGPSHTAVFGSDIYVLQGRLDLAVQRKSRDVLYSRPTMQAKRREAKINEIVTAAANVFAAEGHANFTQARIARELGLLPSALQHYFPTREDLFNFTVAALMNTYLDRYADMVRPSDKPALQRLCVLIEDVFEENCDPRVCRFWLEMLSVTGRSEIAQELLKRAYFAYRAIYVDLVREIDRTATARECLSRATLIVTQLEGLLIFIGRGTLRLPDLDDVLELMKVTAIEIAQGSRRLKEAS
ncbi:TetR/AcrR family transcriptional regulator [Trinickia violacea]|uniref:TetR/AcrR family transcriptional regulator n=1 Tax=Trinickia violacea TaxID=2571746 RepID=A0A4P8IQA7_9BURK|nr:TetR/AcrR family transcriptional regulator [Trinickia violacea]QCP49074.1 TetR/AcrR family transcriptional regulator [Trinickia violacea]